MGKTGRIALTLRGLRRARGLLWRADAAKCLLRARVRVLAILFHRWHIMQSKEPVRLPYTAPRLRVYGDLTSLTQTNSDQKNKNDALQGQNNLKT